MSFVRYVLIVLLILAPAWIGHHFVPEHTGHDTNPFVPLFSHLLPAPLVTNPETAHEEGPHYMLAIDASWAPAAFDADQHLPASQQRAGTQIVMTNLQLFQIAAVLLVIVCFSGVPRYLRTGKGDAVSRLFAGFVMWLRDEMVYPAMGKETGRKFLPYLLTLFFFILFMNLLGLIPGSATATASVFVTGGLALTTLGLMLFGGMIAQGPVAYWKNLTPHVPAAIWPLMFGVELIGLVVKPFALTIRLFANMIGGHMVVLSFVGLVFVLVGLAGNWAYAGSALIVPFAVFIMIIESFVALLQAYVFAMLSIMFIQASIHPEH